LPKLNYKNIPTDFFDMLPLPIIVLKYDKDTLNHSIIYLNSSFDSVISWSREEIPDKAHWWGKAYPEPKYQKVVESLWELKMESMLSANNVDNFAIVIVNVTTKYNGVKRFKVYSEFKSVLIDGYYVVAFKEIENN